MIDIPWRKIGEECGVIGVFTTDSSNATQLVHRGLFALQHRGQEAAGIVSLDKDNNYYRLKGNGLVSESLPLNKINEFKGNISIGHVRYSTVPVDGSINIQPLTSDTVYGFVDIAHNGHISNAAFLRKRLEDEGVVFETTMDTEVIPQLMNVLHQECFEKNLFFLTQYLEGSYSIVLINNGCLYVLRDVNGIRPLVLGVIDNGWVVASETCALDAVKAKYVREINAGEILKINNAGPQTIYSKCDISKINPCVFELVYFSRPDSIVFSQSVYKSRIKMGIELAKENSNRYPDDRDIVVPVPDSGVPAAIGYSRYSKIPFEKAIIRSHYVGRSFILPSQDSRINAISMKLSVIEDAVYGKRVILIDDSLIRGNTSKAIIQMLRNAGASEVHMYVSSPPIVYPCCLGIDTPTKEELIFNQQKGMDGVKKYINADSLYYLSINGLKRAVNGENFCFSCFKKETKMPQCCHRGRDNKSSGLSLWQCENEAMEGFTVCFEHVSKDALATMIDDLRQEILRVKKLISEKTR